ncbi:MAG TPA: hypothetical protein DEP68_12145, partial [Erythrobacter sp.]|nr:hypothetical protein [Erythrobacter sp.]
MGLTLVEIDWRAPLECFDDIALVLLGTAWDYQDHAQDFLGKLDALADRGVRICNSPDIVRWNANKRYLEELAERGATTVPTLWLDDVDRAGIIRAMDEFDTDRIVVKRQIGAGALGQHSFTRTELPREDWAMRHACMVQ